MGVTLCRNGLLSVLIAVICVCQVWSAVTFPDAELQALEDLYNLSDGPHWTWQNSTDYGIPWDFSVPEPNPCISIWQGINCSYEASTCNVISLDLSVHNLRGPLSGKLDQLTKLRKLILYANYLSHTIPASVGSLAYLQYLALDLNAFTGTIPSTLGQLSNIEGLDLGYNLLSGSIPASLVAGSGLLGFGAGYNHLTGTLPEWPAQILSISIADNLLSGSISASIAACSDLIYLTIYHNQLTGTLPDAFADMQQLYQIAAYENHLSGPLRPSIGDLGGMYGMFLYTNRLSGTLPDTLAGLQQLTELSLYDNFISGALPPSLAQVANLADLELQDNLLSGPLSTELQLPLSLLGLDLSYNHLSGPIPACLSQLPVLNELQLQNNLLTGSLDSVFNSSLQPALTIVQVSSNQLTGTLPAELFLLPALETFAGVSNCFEGPLPITSMCNSSTLRTLVLDGLRSASSCQQRLLPGISGAHTITHPLSGGVPACLLELPTLATLHLSGNGLTGPLPEQVCAPSSDTGLPSLALPLLDLSLSHNELTGTIPACIQERLWRNLDLSYNRLSGSLDPDFASGRDSYSPVGLATALSLQKNRLSGKIPGGLDAYWSLSMLTSNLFSCRLDRGDLPHQDGDRLNYQCGSEYFDFPYYLWMGIMGILVLLIAIAAREARTRNAAVALLTALREGWDTSLRWITYGSLNASGQRQQGAAPPLAYVTALHSLSAVVRVAGFVLIFAVVVLFPLYLGLGSAYSTVTHKYAWRASSAYLSGTVPAVLVLVFVVVMLCVFLVVWRAHSLAQDVRTDSSVTRAEMEVSNEDGNKGDYGASMEPGSPLQVEESVALASVRTQRVLLLVGYLLVNFAVVAAVNTGYVLVALYASGATFVASQVLLSLFKLAWNRIGGVYLMRYAASRGEGEAAFERRFGRLRVLVALCNNIVIPCLVVAITSPDCFYNVLAAAPSVVANYQYRVCLDFYAPGEYCTEYRTADGTTSYSPPFAYSYQCSAAFVTYYAPAFLYLCLTASFLSPLAQYTLYKLHRRALPAPSSLWFRTLDAVLPPSLRTIPAHNGEGGHVAANPMQPYFDAAVLQTNLVTYLGLMLTFGAAFPPLCAALMATVVVVVAMARFKTGRFAAKAVEARGGWVLEVLQLESSAVLSVFRLPAVPWMLASVSCWFFTLFLFDTLGDAVGFEGAYWVLIVMPLMPAVLYGVERAVTLVNPLTHVEQGQRGRPGAGKGRNSELTMVAAPVASPLASASE